MPNKALAIRRPPQPAGWQAWAWLAALGTVSLATLAAGILCLWTHTRVFEGEHLLAPAGIVCLASCLAQLRIAIAGWRNRRIATRQNPLGQVRFWRWLFAGAFFAYLAALAVGPLPYLGCAWLAAVSVWYALLLLPLAASPHVLDGWRKWSQGRTARRLDWLVVASFLLLICAEAGLRAEKFAVRHGWLADSDSLERIDASDWWTPAPDPQPTGVRVVRFDSKPFRVAIFGDEAALGGLGRSGYLARVQQMLPGLEIVPLRLRPAWSSQPAGELAAQLAACRPDLTLAAISVCADLAHRSAGPTWFDWRQFELAGRLTGVNRWPEPVSDSVPPAAAGDDFETFLRVLAPRLAACRTPIDETMRARWQQTFASLDDLLGGCRARQVPVALVLVPSEFQVSRALCETLARRTGSTAEQFDVDLPQRRLADFAQQRNVPVLDLVPHLRLCRQSLYERNATAWNEQGNAAAAAVIGRWLESRYGGDPALAARLSRAP